MIGERQKKAKYVSSCFQLGILLEVSAPKPGNVNRMSGFQRTKYEHFLASAVAVQPSFEEAALRGCLVSENEMSLREAGIGGIVKDAVSRISSWQSGGNTLLGAIILLSPLAVAAGMNLSGEECITSKILRSKLDLVVKSTTSADAVNLYEAIGIASPGGLTGKAPDLDVSDPNSVKLILENNVSLYNVFEISSSYDSVSREWVENYPITFETGLPYFRKQLQETDLNTAIVHTFLKVLSKIPDTLVARKAGDAKAKEVSRAAGQVLKAGGIRTGDGQAKFLTFDKWLRAASNTMNPGTTADIIAAVIAVSLLEGFRP